MDLEFCIQDPTNPETHYLYEAIIGAAAEATLWRGLYAFATRGGVDQLIEDPVIQDFISRGGAIDLIVGIDAVTNRQTLERMQELEARHSMFRARVFWHSTRGLFHPKISHFGYPDGRRKLIVGSGNLTPGGLMHNFEAYSVVTTGFREALDLSSLDDFIARHKSDIRRIDQEALERAALNVTRPISGATRPRAQRPKPPGAPTELPVKKVQASGLGRVLIAEVPDAGGRWSQAHLNAAVIDDYFRVTKPAQRVYLTHVDASGIRGEERVRPVVYSRTNKNYKIEISAAKGKDYPASGHPILIFLERQVRCFDYMLLMPGDAGYTKIASLSKTLPKLGKGFRRSITDLSTLFSAWPDCPLLTTIATLDEGV